MDLRFGIQLILHWSDCLLFHSENVIKPTLFHSVWKTQHSRYSLQFLESLTYYADNILPIFSVKRMINAHKIIKIKSYFCAIIQC